MASYSSADKGFFRALVRDGYTYKMTMKMRLFATTAQRVIHKDEKMFIKDYITSEWSVPAEQ